MRVGRPVRPSAEEQGILESRRRARSAAARIVVRPAAQALARTGWGRRRFRLGGVRARRARAGPAAARSGRGACVVGAVQGLAGTGCDRRRFRPGEGRARLAQAVPGAAARRRERHRPGARRGSRLRGRGEAAVQGRATDSARLPAAAYIATTFSGGVSA